MKTIKDHNVPSKPPSGTSIHNIVDPAAADSLARQPQLPSAHEARRLLPPRESRAEHTVTGANVARPHNQESRVPTSGEVLRDGSFLELVRDPHDRARALLLHWADGKSTITREFAYDA